MPAASAFPFTTDTTFEFSTSVDVIPGTTYGYSGYNMDAVSLSLYGGTDINMAIQWKDTGTYTIEFVMLKRALDAGSTLYGNKHAYYAVNTVMADTIMHDSLVMNVVNTDFFYSFPTELDTENVVAASFGIVANSYADQNGYLGYQLFQAPLESTSYSDVTSNMSSYLSMETEATTGGTFVFSGNMANYNRIPLGSSTISLRKLEEMNINSNVLAKAEGEYMLVFYTVDQVNATVTDTLRIDTILFRAKALELPSIDTIINVDPVVEDDSTTFKFADTNKVVIGFNLGGYASTYGSLSFRIEKDGVPITDLSEYGSISITMPNIPNFTFKTDTTFVLTTPTGEIPGATYNYGVTPAFDAATLNLIGGGNLNLNVVWKEPGTYRIIWDIYKRAMGAGSVVTNYTTDGKYATVTNTTKGKLLMSDTLTMTIMVPEVDFTVDSIMNTKDTYTDSIVVKANSYETQNGYIAYQVMYAPLFTSSYTDITSSFSTYGTIQVNAKKGSSTIYSEYLTANDRFPKTATPTIGYLADSLVIETTTRWNTAGRYAMYFYTINTSAVPADTLCVDTVEFIVGATYISFYTDSICNGNSYSKYGFDTTISSVGTHALLHALKTVYGCDSNIAVSLTVLPSYEMQILTTPVCRGAIYSANGFYINTRDSAAGTYNYQRIDRTVNGCDSVINLQIMVADTAQTVLTASVCQGTRYTANGFNVLPTAAGIYKYTNFLHTYKGCDSTVVLNLTVHPTSSLFYMDEVCYGKRYNRYGFDTVLTASTVLTKHLNTINGCDSFVTVSVTVDPIHSTPINDRICRSEGRYTKNGFNIKLPAGISSLDSSLTYQSINGCDSTVTLHLVIDEGGDTAVNVTLCQNERYSSLGIDTIFTAPGTYKVERSLNAANGCDSVVRYTFTVKPTYSVSETIDMCEEDSVLYNGIKYGAGTYTIIFPATYNRCDSVVSLKLVAHSIERDTISATPCRGTQPVYYFGKQELTQSGYYEDTIQVNNCYKINVLNLVFSDTVSRPLAIYGDTNIYAAGNYTYFVDTVPGATSYLWETTDITWTISANNETAIVNIPTPGSGLIMVSSVNACGVSSKQSVQVFSAVPVIDAKDVEADANLFPNPAQNNVTLTVKGMEGNAQIRITDVTGKVVYSENVEVSVMGSSFDMNVADYAKGVYMVSIVSDNASVLKKLVIK